MAKHATKFFHCQLVDCPRSVAVQVQLPLLGALGNGENAFFELCVEVGQQVFSVLMEQDQESLCGPKGSTIQSAGPVALGAPPATSRWDNRWCIGRATGRRVQECYPAVGRTCRMAATRGQDSSSS